MPRGLVRFALLSVIAPLLLGACTRTLPEENTGEISNAQASQTAQAYLESLANLASTAASPGEDTTPFITIITQTVESPTITLVLTPLPQATLTLSPPATSPAPSQPQPTTAALSLAPPMAAENAGCNQVKYVRDVSIPDNTTLRPGQSFVKTWRLRNTGSCKWTTQEYALVFVDGAQMGGKPAYLPVNIGPGEAVNLSMALVAPKKAGTYRGYWMLQGPQGRFGLGDVSNKPFWVQIKVR